MDGSNLQELCYDVQDVLSVKEDKIIFVSVDDRTRITNEFGVASSKIVKSIYAVDFTGSGRSKLAYNINNAEQYDDDTIYYIAVDNESATNTDLSQQVHSSTEVLYRLDVNTNATEKILELQMTKAEVENDNWVKPLIMIIAVLLMIIGFASGAIILGVIGLVAAIGMGIKWYLDKEAEADEE
jgi:ribosomal protein S6